MVLQLVKTELAGLHTDEANILVVPTDPWGYNPAPGVKESLISEVLSALEIEVNAKTKDGNESRKLFKRLVQCVDWERAIILAAKSSLLMQIPSFDELVGLVKDPKENSEGQARGLEAWLERNSFESSVRSFLRRGIRTPDIATMGLPSSYSPGDARDLCERSLVELEQLFL